MKSNCKCKNKESVNIPCEKAKRKKRKRRFVPTSDVLSQKLPNKNMYSFLYFKDF